MAGHVPWERVIPRLVDVIHAERFGPPMGVQGGMGIGANLFIHLYSVHFCLQHIHVFDSIGGDGAISATTAICVSRRTT